MTQKNQDLNTKLFRISRLLFGIYLGFSICNLGFAPQVYAQEMSLVVSPPRTDIEIKPGETIQKYIKVTNTNQTELILGAQIVDFIVQDDLGTPIKVNTQASGRFIASPWFSLDNTEVSIPPKETIQFTVLITAPKDALPGGHYAGIFFEPKERRGENKTVSYTTSQVGTLFGITVPGDIKYDALIKEFKTKSQVSEFGPIEFNAIIENQSDTHIRPNSKIVIQDMFGRKLTDLALDEVNIFPFTSRSLSKSWDTVWGLGRYTATLTVAYGPGLVATRILYFWIMPYKLIAAIIIILLVLIVIFILINRHLKHKDDHRDDEIEDLKRKIVEMENRTH